MIVRSLAPSNRIVTLIAGLREITFDVVRVFGVVEVCDVAVHAIVRGACVALCVTLRTLGRQMGARQLE